MLKDVTIHTIRYDSASQQSKDLGMGIAEPLTQALQNGHTVLLLLSGADTIDSDMARRFGRSIASSIGLGKGATDHDDKIQIFATYYPNHTIAELGTYVAGHNEGVITKPGEKVESFIKSVNAIYRDVQDKHLFDLANRMNIVSCSFGSILHDLIIKDVSTQFEGEKYHTIMQGIKSLETGKTTDITVNLKYTNTEENPLRNYIFLNSADTKVTERTFNFDHLRGDRFKEVTASKKASVYQDPVHPNRLVLVAKDAFNTSFIIRHPLKNVKEEQADKSNYEYKQTLSRYSHNSNAHHHITYMSKHPETGVVGNTNILLPYMVKLTLLSMLENSRNPDRESHQQPLPFDKVNLGYFLEKGYYKSENLREEVFPHHRLIEKTLGKESSASRLR